MRVLLAKWKLREVILMVVLAIVCGGLYRVWDVINALVPTTAYALQAAMTGFWMIAGVLVPYIIRRPVAALIAELVAAAVELLLGGQFGLGTMESGLIQGIGSEIAFLIFAYRVFNLSSCMLSGTLASLAYLFQWYFQYGGKALDTGTMLLSIIISLVSGAILGGWLPKLMGDALKRTGAVRNYAIAKDGRAMPQ
ncbi:ABC transporter permease [Alicyclobacillus sacchari]|uniref:ECF transporter S component n=1 Tax=Alicyclobacillus sacchari TaxID=392010 RepID=UPI001066F04A|nr:ECF transporter S component [Alicyclobacillus sacchari]GMA58490.1 ABC transporter permease [Alicyclobacillus sacchari]